VGDVFGWAIIATLFGVIWLIIEGLQSLLADKSTPAEKEHRNCCEHKECHCE